MKRKSLLVLVSLVLSAGQDAEGQEAERLRLSCDDGNATACNDLGLLYQNGEGVTQDYTRAASLYEIACNGGYAKGCFNLGFTYPLWSCELWEIAGHVIGIHKQACTWV